MVESVTEQPVVSMVVDDVHVVEVMVDEPDKNVVFRQSDVTWKAVSAEHEEEELVVSVLVSVFVSVLVSVLLSSRSDPRSSVSVVKVTTAPSMSLVTPFSIPCIAPVMPETAHSRSPIMEPRRSRLTRLLDD